MNKLKIYLFMFLFDSKYRQNRTFLTTQFIKSVAFTTNLHAVKTYEIQLNQAFKIILTTKPHAFKR